MERIIEGCSGLFRGVFRFFPWRLSQKSTNTPRILAILPDGSNRRMLEGIARESGWALTVSESPDDVERLCDDSPILLYDGGPGASDWPQAVATLTRRTPRPYLILLAPQINSNLWEELQRVGGSDLLRLPLDRDHVTSAIKRAWQVWRNQQRVRP